MKNRQGFTLIELLVVVLIIGILASVGITQYRKVAVKSAFASMKNMARNIAEMEEDFYNNGGNLVDFYDLNIPGTISNKGKDLQLNDDVFCRLEGVLDSNQPKVLCVYREIVYEQYIRTKTYPQFRRNCRTAATDTNSIYHKICQQETGRQTPNGCNSNSNYCRYRY